MLFKSPMAGEISPPRLRFDKFLFTERSSLKDDIINREKKHESSKSEKDLTKKRLSR